MPDYSSKQELTIDLMCHVVDPPPATMDFLFVQLVEYARAQCIYRLSPGHAIAGTVDRRCGTDCRELSRHIA